MADALIWLTEHSPLAQREISRRMGLGPRAWPETIGKLRRGQQTIRPARLRLFLATVGVSAGAWSRLIECLDRGDTPDDEAEWFDRPVAPPYVDDAPAKAAADDDGVPPRRGPPRQKRDDDDEITDVDLFEAGMPVDVIGDPDPYESGERVIASIIEPIVEDDDEIDRKLAQALPSNGDDALVNLSVLRQLYRDGVRSAFRSGQRRIVDQLRQIDRGEVADQIERLAEIEERELKLRAREAEFRSWLDDARGELAKERERAVRSIPRRQTELRLAGQRS